MEQKLFQLKAKIEADNSLVEKLFSLETPEEVQSLLKAEGLDFTVEEINAVREVLVKMLEKNSSELSDDELANVAGGSVLGAVGTVVVAGALIGLVAAGSVGVVGAAMAVNNAVAAKVTRSSW